MSHKNLVVKYVFVFLVVSRRTAAQFSPNCTSCIPEQITFTKGDLDAEYVVPTTNSNGCLEITAYCDPSKYGPKTTTFMQFNINLGGPESPKQSVIEAKMTCENGLWYFEKGGVKKEITEVNCLVAV